MACLAIFATFEHRQSIYKYIQYTPQSPIDEQAS